MSYLEMVSPEKATGNLKNTYDTLQKMFGTIPKVFIAQSLRPDLLEPVVLYVKRLMIEPHGLNRRTKELIAAYVSKLNSCAYCVDAHSAMAMAQGFTQDEVKSIIEDINGSTLIDDKTKHILRFAEKITHHAYKVTESEVQALRDIGCSDEEILESIAVTSLFNFMDRMADALGAPVENFQEMMAKMS